MNVGNLNSTTPPESRGGPGSALHCRTGGCGGRRSRERGSAVVVVLALLLLMVTFVVGNNRTLHSLRRELRLLEERQLKAQSEVVRTNTVPSALPAIQTPPEPEPR